MLLLWSLSGCTWWANHKACTAAQHVEEATWSTFEGALAADAAALDPAATLAAATALDATAAADAAAAAPPPVNTGEAAQDAFTRASRAYGTEKGLAQAGWTDWSLRAQAHATEADRQVTRVDHAVDRLSAWGRALADARLASALARARYEAAVLTGEPRLAVTTAFASFGDLAPPTDPKATDIAVLYTAAGAASADLQTRIESHKAALDDASRLVFNVEHAAQTASADATDYPYLGFPAEAQVARAAALAAGAAGARGTTAVVKLRAAITAHQHDEDTPPTMPEASAAAAAEATKAVSAALAACR